LTLNPIKHIDPWMSILLPAMLWFGSNGQFVFGGAKPVPVDPRNFRNFKRGDLIVSSAGIIANLVLLVCFLAFSIGVGIVGSMIPFGREVLVVVQNMLLLGVWLNALLAFFNLIPIPPLDGSHILYHFLPPNLAQRYRELSRYGILILLGVMFFARDYFFMLLLPAIALTRFAISLVQPFLLYSTPY